MRKREQWLIFGWDSKIEGNRVDLDVQKGKDRERIKGKERKRDPKKKLRGPK